MYGTLDDFVISYGKFGRCSGCGWACESTALIDGKRFCKECKKKQHPKKAVDFQDSDAIFKCRAGSCGADKLTFREVLVGSCCEDALMETPIINTDAKKEQALMSKIHEQIRDKRTDAHFKCYEAEDNLDDMKAEEREAQEALKKAKENVKMAEEEALAARRNREYFRKLEIQSEKRVLIITKAAFETTDEPAAKKSKEDGVNEKIGCRVCFMPYNDEHPSAIIIPCGHIFCSNCISSLPQKKCPNCRANFDDDNIYRTH